jgi:molybdopterin-guanine dinucleotide biosynthesis protein A
VILAGGFSKRFGQDKALIELAGKSLILHVVERLSRTVEETVVVVGSETQKKTFKRLLTRKVSFAVDEGEKQSPLVGALTGFQRARGLYCLLLPCDTPFVSSQIIRFLLDFCPNKDAVIPRWPNGYIEPLHAAYHTKSALTAAKTALEEEKLDLRSMIAHLRDVRYVSTTILQQMDKKLLTFLNVNTLMDLKKAESELR